MLGMGMTLITAEFYANTGENIQKAIPFRPHQPTYLFTPK